MNTSEGESAREGSSPQGIAERFFDQRAVDIDAHDAEDLYRKLEGHFEDAPRLHDHGLNDDFARSQWPEVAFFYRGQADARHGLNSSLFRHLQPEIKPRVSATFVESLLASREQAVLKHARESEGLGRNLTDRELLTVLQHHQAPTRLIDITIDWRVGLFFATETDDSIDGRLFAFALKPWKWHAFRRSTDGTVSWPDDDNNPWQKTVWPILMPFSDPRMIAQQGYFLVGGMATNTGQHTQYWRKQGSAEDEDAQAKALSQAELREVTTLMIKFPARVQTPVEALTSAITGVWSTVGCTVRIPAPFKRELRNVLRRQGIYADSIYPPIDESLRALRHVAGQPREN